MYPKNLKEALARIEELEAELKVSDKLLEDRDAFLSAIPECPAHGKCMPHALEWIEQVKRLSVQYRKRKSERGNQTGSAVLCGVSGGEV